MVISEFFFLSKSGDFGALISQESFVWVLLSLSLYIYKYICCQVMKIHQKQKCCSRTFLKIREQMKKKLHISHNSHRNMTLFNIPLKMWDQMKTTTSFCVSLLNGESKQTKTNRQTGFFFQFGAWIHSKEEDEKGWDERMHGWNMWHEWWVAANG